MKIDALVYEIGSTTTIVNAFDQLNTLDPKFLGSGTALTTVSEGDVSIGIQNALSDLKKKLNISTVYAVETYATSSAAGGLKMSVHGLVYDMTVKAAKEACLGAGANIKIITAGKLTNADIHKIQSENLNIIMISGGVDYGEKETALYNAQIISSLNLNIPVIYAGNIQNQEEIRSIFQRNDQAHLLFITDNVYPKIDTLSVDKTRLIIQSIFEKHITEAPGMDAIRSIINNHIMPTPGAVMESTLLLSSEFKDIMTVDIGGATTDIHSVTEGYDQITKLQIHPEPFAKRTVEGDLGVYINHQNIINLIPKREILLDLKINEFDLNQLQANLSAIPSKNEISFVKYLSEKALAIALSRHAGRYTHLYSSSGKTTYVEGKDLSKVAYIIATGGALTRLGDSQNIIQKALFNVSKEYLIPRDNVKILVDQDYIMASIGVLSLRHKESGLKLLKNSLIKE